MEELIAEIREVLSQRHWTVGLQTSLALIDICGSLEQTNGEATGSAFKAWFGENLNAKYSYIDPADVYKLRCGILHQGRLASKNFKAIAFTLPDPNYYSHGNIINGALFLDLVTFCGDVSDAASAWWVRQKNEEPVRANATSLVQFRPDGLEPYMLGVPVIG